MSTTTTELPGLLRGCIVWRSDRPRVDNEALLIVADWCEENGNQACADAIRTPIKMLRPRGLWLRTA